MKSRQALASRARAGGEGSPSGTHDGARLPGPAALACLASVVLLAWITATGSIGITGTILTLPGVGSLVALSILCWRPTIPETHAREVPEPVDAIIVYAGHDRSITEATIRATQAVRGVGTVTLVVPADRSLPGDLPADLSCQTVHAEEAVTETATSIVQSPTFLWVRTGRLLHRDYIEETNSLFDDPAVALVQPNGNEPALRGERRRHTHRYRLQAGRNGWNAMIWDGADGHLRTAALVEVVAEGGRPRPASLAAHMQAHKWRTWFVDAPLSTAVESSGQPTAVTSVPNLGMGQKICHALGPDISPLLTTVAASAVAVPWIIMAWSESSGALPWLASCLPLLALHLTEADWLLERTRALTQPPAGWPRALSIGRGDRNWLGVAALTAVMWTGIAWHGLHDYYRLPEGDWSAIGTLPLLFLLLCFLLQGEPDGSALRIVASLPVDLESDEGDSWMGAVDVLDDAGLRVWLQAECHVGTQLHGNIHFLGTRIPVNGIILRSDLAEGQWCADIHLTEVATERIEPLHHDRTGLSRWATRWTGSDSDVAEALSDMKRRRRSASRHEIHLPVLIHGPDGPTLAVSENASATGLGIRSDRALPVDVNVTIDVLHPRIAKGIAARVTRCEEGDDAGHRFIGLAFEETSDEVAAAARGTSASPETVRQAAPSPASLEDHRDPLGPLADITSDDAQVMS